MKPSSNQLRTLRCIARPHWSWRRNSPHRCGAPPSAPPMPVNTRECCQAAAARPHAHATPQSFIAATVAALLHKRAMPERPYPCTLQNQAADQTVPLTYSAQRPAVCTLHTMTRRSPGRRSQSWLRSWCGMRGQPMGPPQQRLQRRAGLPSRRRRRGSASPCCNMAGLEVRTHCTIRGTCGNGRPRASI